MRTIWAAALVLVSFPFEGRAQSRAPLQGAELEQTIGALSAADLEQRIEAIEAIGRRGHRARDRVAEQLGRLLREDPAWRARASAGRAIGRLGIRDAVPQLVAALRDERADVRVVAAAALWRLPDAAAVPALVTSLEDSDAAVRQWSALALGVIGDPRAVEPLLSRLGDDGDEVRMDAIRSLGRIGDPRALDALDALVRNRRRARTERLEAINSIATLRGSAKLQRLQTMLDLPDAQVRAQAARALQSVGDALVIPRIRERLQRERNRTVRQALEAAIEALREQPLEH